MPDIDTAREWFTAGEAAAIARRNFVDGVPWTARCMARRLASEAASHQVRKRKGRLQEWHLSAFPDALRVELEIEAGAVACAAETPSCFSEDDFRIMRAALGVAAFVQVDFEPPIARRVRRQYVVVDCVRYYICAPGLEGQKVLVTRPLQGGAKPALVWRYDETRAEIAAHGEAGFIGMLDPPALRWAVYPGCP